MKICVETLNLTIKECDIMDTLESLVEKVNALEQSADENTATLVVIKDKQTSIQEAQATTDLKLDDIRALVATLEANGGSQEKIDALGAKLDTVVSKQAAIKSQLAALDAQTDVLAAQTTSVRDEANSVE